MFITIFTATYNRCHLLKHLYESICRQTIHDFEWIIVDDGSTDETKKLVRRFIEENKIDIRYFFQKNSGKHIAINKGLAEAKGHYFLSIDSDDYLADNCLEICQKLADETESKNIKGGFTFIHTSAKNNFILEQYGNKRWEKYNSYKWSFKGEMSHVFKTKKAKEFLFPWYEDENFCQESVQIIPIIKKYGILYSDHILAFGEYLEDGLSQNLYQRLLDNPKYAMLSFKTKLLVAKDKTEKKQLAKNYWDIVFKTRQPKIYAFISFPIILTLLVLLKRINQKLFN